jgi:hypothetical protein
MNEQASSSETTPVGASRAGRGRVVAGGVLLAVALFALISPYLPRAVTGQLFPALLGVAFIVWAALARTSGLLVPGGILVGVGVGAWLQPQFGPAAFLLSMAGGFLLISVLSLALFGAKKNTWWTVWPALGLGFAALAAGGGPEVRELFRQLRDVWPWALLIVAAGLLWSGLRQRG